MGADLSSTAAVLAQIPQLTAAMTTGSASYWTPSNDHIYIQRSRATGSDGVFVVAHEYGHALHNASLGGLVTGQCPSPHYVDGAYNEQCAFTEGVANWHALVSRGTDIGSWYTTLHDGFPTTNGYKVEGAVAAFMFGITDSGGGARYPASWTADVVLTCSVSHSGSWSHVSAAEGLVWCLEGGVSSSDQSSYFSGSSISTVSTSSTPPESNPTRTNKVRPIWLWHLKGTT